MQHKQPELATDPHFINEKAEQRPPALGVCLSLGTQGYFVSNPDSYQCGEEEEEVGGAGLQGVYQQRPRPMRTYCVSDT